jgi:phosphohistidine phosphatase
MMVQTSNVAVMRRQTVPTATDVRNTMRQLLVLRHAKSRWDQPSVDDHDRGLAPRGEAAARKMGALIVEEDWLPDRILCSTALRAQQTLALACETWPTTPAIPKSDLATLYLAAPSRILEIVRRQPDECRRLMIVGHNPGLQTFVARLAGHGDKAQRLAIETKFPTAALALVALDDRAWAEVGWTIGRLVDYRTPRECEAAPG